MSTRLSFIERFGHVQYLQVMRRPAHWRIAAAAKAVCEFTGCDVAGGYYALIFDHCHRHGVVRGVLCTGCNVRVGRIEAVMTIEGVTVDLGTSAYGQWLSRCPDCAGTPRLLPQGPFVPLVNFARAPKPAVVAMSSTPFSLPRMRTAHLLLNTKGTLCGLVADAMVPSEEKPICGGCRRRVPNDAPAFGDAPQAAGRVS